MLSLCCYFLLSNVLRCRFRHADMPHIDMFTARCVCASLACRIDAFVVLCRRVGACIDMTWMWCFDMTTRRVVWKPLCRVVTHLSRSIDMFTACCVEAFRVGSTCLPYTQGFIDMCVGCCVETFMLCYHVCRCSNCVEMLSNLVC